MQPLDVLTLKLKGRCLIEASAGTGKTYTLVLLYLRLLLEKNVTVNNILVVTFTRAATEELRDRIRQRIREAIHFIECSQTPDSQLQDILQRVDAKKARQRLKEALVEMDEAAIFTIHGFCQRMLQEHAFESAAPFSVTFLESEQQLRQQIIEDFWRNHFYTASEELADWITATWKDPAGLLMHLSGALSAPAAEVIPSPVDSQRLGEMERHCQRLYTHMLQVWAKNQKEVMAILEDDPCLQRNDKAYRKRDRVPELAAAMLLLANATTQHFPWFLPPCLSLLRSSVMAGRLLKKCDQPPEHPFFDCFEAFATSQSTLVEATRVHILHESRKYLLSELDNRKQGQDWMSFDDLLARLDAALASPESGSTLASRIHNRYPVALVDEFQDTDPLQYRILQRIYQYPDSSLFMIGDPKQAIYSFRGADIFTYIRAKRETDAADRFTMDTNYRSIATMVTAVNTLFQVPDAFVFNKDITFQPVRPGGNPSDSGLVSEGSPVSPLTALLLPTDQFATRPNRPIAKTNAEHPSAEFCAHEIASLLTRGQSNQASIAGKPIVAGDVAVLVRTHHEAALMQQALQHYSISNVYYSQDSVFSTSEARQLYNLLCALTNPADASLVHKALITDLFGHNGTQLYQLQQNELRWEHNMATLRDYQLLWREQGFIPMFLRLLAEQQVARRLTALPGGERSLTNLLHLAELLQQASGRLHGTESLLRWFNHQLHDADEGGADQQLRLENDGDLVRIVTIHKAKGLEYPIVFLPFLWNARGLSKERPLAFHDRHSFNPVVSLDTSQSEHQKLSEEERLAEELRLLYVALTRAKYCCFFCWGFISKVESTGLAHLLHRNANQGLDEQQLVDDLKKLNIKAPLLSLRAWPEAVEMLPQHQPKTSSHLEVKHFKGHITGNWQVTSYSQLTSHTETTATTVSREEVVPVEEDFQNIFTFPRGAEIGTCIHNIFEQLDFTEPVDNQRQLIRDQLELASIRLEWEQGCVDWIDAILETRLNSSLSLRVIEPAARIKEMTFLFPLERLDFREINLVLAHKGIQPFPSTEGVIQGLMKGFIDLVFRHDSTYYLADYKSNHLGSEISGYAPEALTHAMLDHRYDLQYLIYTVALHRYLQRRLPGYSYETHFGGAYYLFLRGMHPLHPQDTGIFFYRPDYDLIDKLDKCFGDGGAR